ncbi:hypothetical protein [Ferrimonas marina]|uniref:Fusaric acid resistance protein-like n=1 Tax=Ferrimonas marina TaxID=299255 RepID=A0A1M5NEA0_9GAMM|nr:hypothetical protein [Ferrimonas marina]SHG87787.1 hypothetical protein SAMN02745129_1015 [Ferrimonas marina]
MFHFDWQRFNWQLGAIFAIGVVTVSLLLTALGAPAMVAGFSALLAWLPIVMADGVSLKQRLWGLLLFAALGPLLLWLYIQFDPFSLAHYAAIALVTLLGYLCLCFGTHLFLLAWGGVYWFLLLPLFVESPQDTWAVSLAYIAGVSLVLLINLVKPLLSRPADTPVPSANESLPIGQVFLFACLVALSIVIGLWLGKSWLTVDPTLVANATLNMISPSLRQTWQGGVERLILGLVAIVSGFYLGWWFPQVEVAWLVTVISAFLALGCLFVNINLTVAMVFFLLSYTWGSLGTEAAHRIANEKLLAELLGVAIALVAIGTLAWYQRNRGK